jgi:hypothetical protein
MAKVYFLDPTGKSMPVDMRRRMDDVLRWSDSDAAKAEAFFAHKDQHWTLMAEVSGSPEQAWKWMQNGVVTDSWTLSPPPGLKVLVQPVEHNGRTYGHRSMDIGDVVEMDDGSFWMCASAGFTRL